MKPNLLVTAGVLVANVAIASANHVLVTKSDGNADGATRTRIDGEIVTLAKNLGGNVEAGDISYSDAAAAVGCNPVENACKDEVLATLGVDELVITKVDKAGGQLKVTVRRVAKSGMPKEATSTVPPTGGDDKLAADIGPLFGVSAPKPAATTTTAPPPPPPTTTTAPPPRTTAPPPPVTTTAPPPSSTTTAPPPATTETGVGMTGEGVTSRPPATTGNPPPRTGQLDDNVTAAPNGQITGPSEATSHRKMEIEGMVGGGALMVISFVLWAEANAIQGDINNAPVGTPTDFKNLKDLEDRGDTYATFGNIFFIGGLAVTGVSTYFFIRDGHRSSSSQARITPAVFDHGAGVALTFGGGR